MDDMFKKVRETCEAVRERYPVGGTVAFLVDAQRGIAIMTDMDPKLEKCVPDMLREAADHWDEVRDSAKEGRPHMMPPTPGMQ